MAGTYLLKNLTRGPGSAGPFLKKKFGPYLSIWSLLIRPVSLNPTIWPHQFGLLCSELLCDILCKKKLNKIVITKNC